MLWMWSASRVAARYNAINSRHIALPGWTERTILRLRGPRNRRGVMPAGSRLRPARNAPQPRASLAAAAFLEPSPLTHYERAYVGGVATCDGSFIQVDPVKYRGASVVCHWAQQTSSGSTPITVVHSARTVQRTQCWDLPGTLPDLTQVSIGPDPRLSCLPINGPAAARSRRYRASYVRAASKYAETVDLAELRPSAWVAGAAADKATPSALGSAAAGVSSDVVAQ